MDWDTLDYAVFGAMLLVGGIIFTLAKRKANGAPYKFGAGVALLAAFAMVWINGAVGIIGDSSNDANMMFFGILGVAGLGSIIGRFKPKGMSRAMVVTAIVQAGVGGFAIIGRLGSSGPAWPDDIMITTAFFVTLWLVSAWLFRKAERSNRPFERTALRG